MSTRDLAEHLAASLNGAHGETRIELIFSDGRLVTAWVHRKLNARDLPPAAPHPQALVDGRARS